MAPGKEAAGFSLYTLRALLDGRGAELVELAKTNLLRWAKLNGKADPSPLRA